MDLNNESNNEINENENSNYEPTLDPKTESVATPDPVSQHTSESAYTNPFGNPQPQTNSYNNYSGYNDDAPKKRNRGLKTAAAILCAAILCTGAAFGFKIYKDNKDKDTLSEFNSDTDTRQTNANADPSSDYYESGENDLFKLAARTDAKPIPDIVDDIMPSVVGVSATFEFTQQYNFFGWTADPTTDSFTATGTGIVMTDDGYIVTNAHCIYDDSSSYRAGKAVDVSILFSDETQHDATIISYDTETDIAVLKVDETGLIPATFGNSNELRVGELVIAVGNPLGFDFFGSVTSGIVSALNRQVSINDKKMNLIQTDAAINSGNSGGPLLNSCGQVIGINSAKMSSSYGSGSASVEGLGFAIPINDAKRIIDDLINIGYVSGRPQLGIVTKEINETYSNYLKIPMGLYVYDVDEGGAADLAGIKISDVIIAIEDVPVKTQEELNEVKNQYKAGDTITLKISRQGEDIDIRVTLQEKHQPEEYQPETQPERPRR